MNSATTKVYRVFNDEFGAMVREYRTYSEAQHDAMTSGERSELGYSVRTWDGQSLKKIATYCRADFI